MGIWHCQVLATDIIEAPVKAKPSAASLSGRPGVTYQQMVRLLIGDPWNGGARTEMVVPITTKWFPNSSPSLKYCFRDQVPNVGELCDLLVLSKTRTFRDFQASFPKIESRRLLFGVLGGSRGILSSKTCLVGRISFY